MIIPGPAEEKWELKLKTVGDASHTHSIQWGSYNSASCNEFWKSTKDSEEKQFKNMPGEQFRIPNMPETILWGLFLAREGKVGGGRG